MAANKYRKTHNAYGREEPFTDVVALAEDLAKYMNANGFKAETRADDDDCCPHPHQRQGFIVFPNGAEIVLSAGYGNDLARVTARGSCERQLSRDYHNAKATPRKWPETTFDPGRPLDVIARQVESKLYAVAAYNVKEMRAVIAHDLLRLQQSRQAAAALSALFPAMRVTPYGDGTGAEFYDSATGVSGSIKPEGGISFSRLYLDSDKGRAVLALLLGAQGGTTEAGDVAASIFRTLSVGTMAEAGASYAAACEVVRGVMPDESSQVVFNVAQRLFEKCKPVAEA